MRPIALRAALPPMWGWRACAAFPSARTIRGASQAPDDAVVAQRCEALGRIVRGDNCIMVASARALLRCVPPVESRYWESTTFAVGEEIPFDEVPQRLVGMGYTNAGAADAPGLFRVHGDTVEVFPAQEKAPVRIEFFGDEIDRIRRMVSSTGQTIGNEDSIEIFPCRELALTDEAVHNMHVALYRASQDDSKRRRCSRWWMHASSRRARPLFAGDVRPDREPAVACDRQGARGAVRAALAVR